MFETLLVVGQGRRLFKQKLIDGVVFCVIFLFVGAIFVDEKRAVLEPSLRTDIRSIVRIVRDFKLVRHAWLLHGLGLMDAFGLLLVALRLRLMWYLVQSKLGQVFLLLGEGFCVGKHGPILDQGVDLSAVAKLVLHAACRTRDHTF